MGAIRLLIIYTLIVLNAAAAVYMETHMASWYRLEMLVILVGLLASLIVMIALAVEAEWAWPLATIFFSLAIANLVFEFSISRRYIAFLVALVLNVFAFLISILSVGEVEPEPLPESPPPAAPSVETYEVKHEAAGDAPKKRGRKKLK